MQGGGVASETSETMGALKNLTGTVPVGQSFHYILTPHTKQHVPLMPTALCCKWRKYYALQQHDKQYRLENSCATACLPFGDHKVNSRNTHSHFKDISFI